MLAYISANGFDELPDDASMADKLDSRGLIGWTFLRTNNFSEAGTGCEVLGWPTLGALLFLLREGPSIRFVREPSSVLVICF